MGCREGDAFDRIGKLAAARHFGIDRGEGLRASSRRASPNSRIEHEPADRLGLRAP
jgi:hypothetical protein